MARKIPKNLVEIYGRLSEIRAQKGKNSLWPGEWYKHPFKGGAVVLGVNKTGSYRLRAGDIVLISRQGRRLWKFFNYGEEDL